MWGIERRCEDGGNKGQGRYMQQKDERDSAIADYTEAIRLESDDAGMFFQRDQAYSGKGDGSGGGVVDRAGASASSI